MSKNSSDITFLGLSGTICPTADSGGVSCLGEWRLRGHAGARRLAFAPVFQSFRDIVGKEIGELAFSDADAEQSRKRHDWAAYFLNWLVLAVLAALGGVTAVVAVLTLPLALVYLILCYTDETGPVTLGLRRVQVIV